MKILTLMVLTFWCLTVSGQTPDITLKSRQFIRVERIGEASARSFFSFDIAGRNFTIRHDGYGETYAPNVWRKNFNLKMGPSGRLERVYFLEQDTDLPLRTSSLGSI
jgi:hypothetical protein